MAVTALSGHLQFFPGSGGAAAAPLYINTGSWWLGLLPTLIELLLATPPPEEEEAAAGEAVAPERLCYIGGGGRTR